MNMKPPTLPPELCRFRSFASRHKGGRDEGAVYDLLRGRFEFADVETFNDPFEARPCYTPAFKEAGKQRNAMIRFLTKIAPINGGPTQRRQWAEKMLRGKSMWELVNALDMRKHASTELKALCLMEPEAIKTPLPWSHYADAHQGVCLHFNTADFPLNAANPVEYRSEYPKIPIPRSPEKDWEIMQAIILRKCPDWKYEHEYRVVRMEPVQRSAARWQGNIAIGSPQAATAITLGCRMPQPVRVRLIEWIKANTPHVEVWQAGLHRNRYEVTREQLC